jgi:hypothetical protein
MVTPEELQLRGMVESLTHEANAAEKTKDPIERKRVYTAQIEPLAKIAQLRAHNYDFSTAETVLQRLTDVVATLGDLGDAKEKEGIEARILFTEAILFDVRGTYNLFEKLEFVSAPVELEQAEKRYERVALLSEKLGVAAQTVNGVKGMALRAKGIRLFGQGRFNIEAADLKRAMSQLAASKTSLETAASLLQPSADAGEFGPESAMYPGYCTSLAASAEAFGCRCEADGKAFLGKYEEAAALLARQLAMMEKTKQGLLEIFSNVASTLAHRTAQEMELCDKRQKFFATLPAASKITRATILFVILTLIAFAGQVAAVKILGVQVDFVYYIVIMAASFVVGGIGAGLTTWDRGAAYFKEVGVGLVTKDKDDGEKPPN